MYDGCNDYDPDGRNLYWGDLHDHTAWSIDAFVKGNVADGPLEAYLFARGDYAVTLSDGTTVQLEKGKTALDFLAVTDHSEFFDTQDGCVYGDPRTEEYRSDYCVDGYRTDPYVTAFTRLAQIITYPPSLPAGKYPYTGFDCAEDGSGRTDCWAFRDDMWQRTIEAADEADSDDCSFTALIGYEYSGNADTDGQPMNFHRNVIFKSDQVVDYPLDYIHYPTPEEMWEAFDAACLPENGCEAIMIPHNPNDSAGQKWRLEANDDINLLRAKYERLVEIYQHKGSSECLNATAGDPQDGTFWDQGCEFELATTTAGLLDENGAVTGLPDRSTDGPGYVRAGLGSGLETYYSKGYNPLQLGIIASTDTHNTTPGFVQEEAFHGHSWADDDTAAERTQLYESDGDPNAQRYYGPGGLAAVWAPANNRAEIFEALKRRETYGTSGTRIQLWYFQVWDEVDWCGVFDPDAIRRSGGVPMGGTLEASGHDGAPRFVVYARKDSNYADTSGLESHNLLEIDLVQLVVDADGTAQPAVLRRVAAEADGAAVLCHVFTVEDDGLTWDPTVPSTWYARVLETPSQRWSQYDCAQVPCEADMMVDIQERAWSSPIWSLPPVDQLGTRTARGNPVRRR